MRGRVSERSCNDIVCGAVEVLLYYLEVACTLVEELPTSTGYPV